MKLYHLLLVALLAACNNSGDTPKREHPVDHTETEPKQDTNRLQAPADSAAKLQGAIPAAPVPDQSLGFAAASGQGSCGLLLFETRSQSTAFPVPQPDGQVASLAIQTPGTQTAILFRLPAVFFSNHRL